MKSGFSGAVALVVVLFIAGAWYAIASDYFTPRFSDTEAGFEETPVVIPEEEPENVEFEEETEPAPIFSLPPILEPMQNGRVRWSAYWQDMTREEEAVYGTWKRPPGPLRVGLQAGHWKLDEVPEELDGLQASSGAQGGGYAEQKTVLEIAERAKALLEAKGIVVDLLPATIPVDYVADAFVSIHADGSSSGNVSGFKIAGPRRDFSGKSEALVDALYESYGDATGLREDSNITRRMSGYYAFNWRRYDHALHPMTPAAIVETGFMTSATDRAVIVAKPQVAAEGIADGILDFLD